MKLTLAIAILSGTALVAQFRPAGPSYGQGQPAGGAPLMDDERPERGVARIAVIGGDVSVRRGDSGDWIAAGINQPLAVDDRVLTGPNSRAEVQFDWANMARLSENAEIRMAVLDNKRYTIQVAKGVTEFRVLRDYDAEPEISTPSVAIRPLKQGVYRVRVLEDGTSEITVRSGEAEVTTGQGGQRLLGGSTMLVRGSADDPEFQFVAPVPRDEFDQWNEGRDRELQSSQAYKHVPRDVYGAEDLDQHGDWVDDPDNGSVWAPRVAAGWAPYREGRWVWMDYYGWTWVSYDPWGWAPYHYGRWFYSGPRAAWCWAPGSFRSRHYWSPALVAFFGAGRGVGIGFGFGHVGWVPLAPHEPYYRWYGRGVYNGYRAGQVNNITVVNNTNITNTYRNARVNNGITGVAADQFGRGRVQPVALSGQNIQNAGLVRGQLPVAPDRGSLRVTDGNAGFRGTASAAQSNQRFYSTRQPAQVSRVPFEQQRQAMTQSTQRGYDRGAQAPAGGFAGRVSGGGSTPTAPVEAGSRGGGWRRFSEPGGTAPAASPAPGGASQGGYRGSSSAPAGRPSGPAAAPSGSDRGWRRFGDSGGGQGPAAPAAERIRPTESRPRSQMTGSGSSGGSSAPPNWRQFGDPGGNRRAERPSAPAPSRQEAPRPQAAPRQQSAPSGGSHGGGGGSSHSSGGGSSHSSGGGHRK